MLRRLCLALLILAFAASPAFALDTTTAPPNYEPTVQAHAGTKGGEDILLIQTANPWESTANTTVLSGLGYSYRIVDMSEVASVNLSNYQVVLIVNDQQQAFYDNYANRYNEFETYVNNGGVLVFFACDHGWANGDNYTDLPGSVAVGDAYEDHNTIVDSSHPIIRQTLTSHPAAPLTNSDLDGTRCSHNYFVESTLPNNADIILREQDGGRPTLVRYDLGAGSVIASGLTWEYTYDRYVGAGQQYGFGRALADVFKFAFTLTGGLHDNTDLNLEVYAEDNWGTGKKPTVFKHPRRHHGRRGRHQQPHRPGIPGHRHI